MHVVREIAALIGTAGAVAGGAVVIAVAPAGPAGAATECKAAGFTRTDPYGFTREAYHCSNIPDTPVYADEGVGTPVGYLYSGTNWFVCADDHRAYVGGPHPYRWVKTEADDYTWGFVKDTDIYSETDTLPPCFQ